jgi:hypothetical protein
MSRGCLTLIDLAGSEALSAAQEKKGNFMKENSSIGK